VPRDPGSGTEPQPETTGLVRVTLGGERAPTVEMLGVSRRFASASGSVTALDDIELRVHAGRLTVIAGPSGSGKSTLLGIAACIDRADSGMVVVGGIDVQLLSRSRRRELRKRALGLVLPAPSENLLDSLDAAGNLRWSARRRTRQPLADEEVGRLLERVGLHDAERKRVAQLSGGEQQRLALACALVGEPTLVLADEPTASLDPASGALVIAALRSAADGGATLMVASHDAHVIDAADVVIRLDHGVVA
jgi:putative ABC transport system ATP-binding protein